MFVDWIVPILADRHQWQAIPSLPFPAAASLPFNSRIGEVPIAQAPERSR